MLIFSPWAPVTRQGNGSKVRQGRFGLDFRKHFFTEGGCPGFDWDSVNFHKMSGLNHPSAYKERVSHEGGRVFLFNQ